MQYWCWDGLLLCTGVNIPSNMKIIAINLNFLSAYNLSSDHYLPTHCLQLAEKALSGELEVVEGAEEVSTELN